MPWIDLLTIIREILTIIGIIIGLYYGRKGIKRYLLGDILKDKFSDLHKSNKKAFNYTNELLSLIKDDTATMKRLSVPDLEKIKQVTEKLAYETNGSSPEVHTLAVYLNNTINNIQPTISKKNYFEERFSNEFYSLIGATCRRINYYANNVIDLPQHESLEYYSDIKKKFHLFLSNAGFYRLKGYKFGLDISSASALSLVFYNIIDSRNINYVFYRRFFTFIRSNHPIMISIYAHNLYFPGILISKKEELFGYEYLHLIKYIIHKNYHSDGSQDMTVEFFYSNILSNFGFVEGMKEDNFIETFVDNYIETNDQYKKYIDNIKKKADETISFTCNYDDITNFYYTHKKKFKSKLKLDRINS